MVFTRRQTFGGVATLCVATFGLSPAVLADTRSIVVDARYRSMKVVRKEYEEAVLGNGNSRVVNRRITLLVSARRGFDAGFLQVPRNVRILRTHIDLIIFHGNDVRRIITVNLLDLSRSRIFSINQSITKR